MDRWSSRKLCALTWEGWRGSSSRERRCGGVAEWTKAAALKAVEGLVPSVGSNPTPSATPNLLNPGYPLLLTATGGTINSASCLHLTHSAKRCNFSGRPARRPLEVLNIRDV